MILKRVVKVFGGGAGHVTLPKTMIGKDVYVVTEKDTSDLKDLIEKTLLLRRLDEFEKIGLKKEYEDFQREIRSRLTSLELVYKTRN